MLAQHNLELDRLLFRHDCALVNPASNYQVLENNGKVLT